MNLLGLAFVLAAGPAVPVEGSSGPPSVEIVVAGPSADAQSLIDALPEFTEELGVPTRFDQVETIELEHIVSPLTAPAPAPARVWIDVVDPTRARIIVIDGTYERVLIRSVVLEGGLDEVARDEIGYIVEASVEALLAGGQIGISRDVAAEQLGVTPTPTDPDRPRPGLAIEISGGYGARAWGPAAPLHGPLLDIGVGAAYARAAVGGAIELQYLAPVSLDEDPLSLTLTGASMRGLLRVDLRLRGRWSFDIAAGGGIDLLHDRPAAVASTATAFEPRTRVVGDLSLRTGPGLRLGARTHRLLVRLDATLDIALRSYRYVAADTGEIVFDPWVPRPGLRLTFGWDRRPD